MIRKKKKKVKTFDEMQTVSMSRAIASFFAPFVGGGDIQVVFESDDEVSIHFMNGAEQRVMAMTLPMATYELYFMSLFDRKVMSKQSYEDATITVRLV